MRKYSVFTIVLLILTSGCWNRDKEDILSFNNQVFLEQEGSNFKSDIIQLEDGSYRALGTNFLFGFSIFHFLQMN